MYKRQTSFSRKYPSFLWELLGILYIPSLCFSSRRSLFFNHEGKPIKVASVTVSYTHLVYHQYTVQLAVEKRDQVQAALKERGIPSMIYYPLPLQEQEVMRGRCRISGDLNVASRLSRSVLSLPIHTEMTEEEQAYICLLYTSRCV